MTEAAIHLREAAIGYAGRRVLRDIDLTIPAGERVAPLGRSGVGKSTPLNLVYARAGSRAAPVPVPQGALNIGQPIAFDAPAADLALHGGARP